VSCSKGEQCILQEDGEAYSRGMKWLLQLAKRLMVIGGKGILRRTSMTPLGAEEVMVELPPKYPKVVGKIIFKKEEGILGFEVVKKEFCGTKKCCWMQDQATRWLMVKVTSPSN